MNFEKIEKNLIKNGKKNNRCDIMPKKQIKHDVCNNCGHKAIEEIFTCEICEKVLDPYSLLILDGKDPKDWGMDAEYEFFYFCTWNHLFKWFKEHIDRYDHWSLPDIENNEKKEFKKSIGE